MGCTCFRPRKHIAWPIGLKMGLILSCSEMTGQVICGYLDTHPFPVMKKSSLPCFWRIFALPRGARWQPLMSIWCWPCHASHPRCWIPFAMMITRSAPSWATRARTVKKWPGLVPKPVVFAQTRTPLCARSRKVTSTAPGRIQMVTFQMFGLTGRPFMCPTRSHCTAYHGIMAQVFKQMKTRWVRHLIPTTPLQIDRWWWQSRQMDADRDTAVSNSTPWPMFSSCKSAKLNSGHWFTRENRLPLAETLCIQAK